MTWFDDPEADVDDRVEGGPHRFPQEPQAPGHGVNMALRYLGLILPLVVTYWLVLGFGPSIESRLWALTMVSLGAAIWIAATAALIVRRDRNGAAAISVVYVLVDAWMWMLATGVVRFGD